MYAMSLGLATNVARSRRGLQLALQEMPAVTHIFETSNSSGAEQIAY